jgi:hypothetical protein
MKYGPAFLVFGQGDGLGNIELCRKSQIPAWVCGDF